MTKKLTVLFVDDEPNVLRGLRRSMFEMEDGWDMHFCHSGSAALELLASVPVDVVVSDMRMPNMDGAHLLDTVRRLYPQAIRIILSGYAEAESVLKTVSPAHIYLAKPCSAERLRQAISRPLALRKFLSDPTLLAAIGGLANLPSLPEGYLQLLAELARPDSSTASVARILSHDVAMTAEILKLTNSAFFALNSQVGSVFQAVKILGLEIIQTLVLQVGIFRQLDSLRPLAGLLDDLNRFSLHRGALAEAIARDMGESEDVIRSSQFAAMLSTIGILVLLDHDPDLYRKTLSLVQPGTSLFAAEKQTYGTCNAYVGAYLLGLWGFSDAVIEAVAFAACPRSAPSPDSPILLAAHVTQAMGPPMPLLPSGTETGGVLDMAYLVELRKDGQIAHWRQLAAEKNGEDV